MIARLWFLGLLCLALGCGTESSELDTTVDAPTPDGAQVAQNQAVPADPVATTLRFGAKAGGQVIPVVAVKAVKFSPSGEILAVGSGDGFVQLWDMKKQELLREFAAHDNWTFDLDFSPDGDVLATGGGDNLIKLWDVTTGRQRTQTAQQSDDIHGVAFTPNGEQLVSGSDDTEVMLWTLATDERAKRSGHERQITAVAVHPNGKQFASASRDGTIRLWTLPEGTPQQTFRGHEADVIAIRYSPDGKTLASAGYDKTVRIWDLENPPDHRLFKGHKDWVFALAYSPDGKFLFTGAGDKYGYLWDLEQDNYIQAILFNSDVAAADFAPDGKHLAVGLASGGVKIYQFDNRKLREEQTIDPRKAPVKAKDVLKGELSSAKYLKLHNVAMRPGTPEWSEAVASLAAVGDGFTLQILDKIDQRSLTAAESELYQRSRQKIKDRLSAQLAVADVRTIRIRLERAALADLNCDPLEGLLVPWTLKQIRQESGQAAVRKELHQIQQHYVPDGPISTIYGFMQDRVRDYATRILKPRPESDEATR